MVRKAGELGLGVAGQKKMPSEAKPTDGQRGERNGSGRGCGDAARAIDNSDFGHLMTGFRNY